jgi:hypothetical protein
MMPKRYCKVLLVLTLLLLGAVAVFNALVDPLGAYPFFHARTFEPLRHTLFTRTARAELARRGPWDTIVLGTSRPKAGLSADDPFFASHRACNLAFDGARMSEVAALLEFVQARQRLQRVTLFLDFVMFCSTNLYRHDFNQSRFYPHASLFEYHCRNLAGENATQLSWSFLSQMMHGFRPPPGETNGFYVHSIRTKTSQHDLFERVLMSHAAGYAAMRPTQMQWDEFRRLVRLCRHGEIDLVLAINPVHALDLELLRDGGNWPRFEQWKRRLVTLIDEEDGDADIPLWDFSGYNAFTTEEVPPAGSRQRMEFYFENSHYTPALGKLMLDRIFRGATVEFGARISTQNIESHLQFIRGQRQRYADTHSEQVQWVKNISARAGATSSSNEEDWE